MYLINDCHPLKYFLKEHIVFLLETGEYEITVLANQKDCNDFLEFTGLNIVNINITRKPDLIKDLASLFFLIKYLSKHNYNIVHSITPKSGLLLSVASKITNVPHRFHTFTGQVWANYTGFKRFVFICIDRLICVLNTRVLADSFSQRDYLVNQKVVYPDKIFVLGFGSICGVNRLKFKPKFNKQIALRIEYCIPLDSFVLLYIGRLNKDKGINDLIKAFELLDDDELFLLIVGKDEEEILISHASNICLKKKSNFLYFEETQFPEKFMSLADVICLPSYREGFGNVIIEAAAVGTPSIVSDVYGLQDAIIENVTGVRFRVGDITDLMDKICFYKTSKNNLLEMSLSCINFVKSNFDSDFLTSCLHDFYQINLKSK